MLFIYIYIYINIFRHIVFPYFDIWGLGGDGKAGVEFPSEAKRAWNQDLFFTFGPRFGILMGTPAARMYTYLPQFIAQTRNYTEEEKLAILSYTEEQKVHHFRLRKPKFTMDAKSRAITNPCFSIPVREGSGPDLILSFFGWAGGISN